MLDVPKVREALKKIKEGIPLKIRMNNAFIYYEKYHQIIWDDENECFYAFSHTAEPEFPNTPINVTATPYDLIESIEVYITKDYMEEAIKQIKTLKKNGTDIITTEQEKAIMNNPAMYDDQFVVTTTSHVTLNQYKEINNKNTESEDTDKQ